MRQVFKQQASNSLARKLLGYEDIKLRWLFHVEWMAIRDLPEEPKCPAKFRIATTLGVCILSLCNAHPLRIIKQPATNQIHNNKSCKVYNVKRIATNRVKFLCVATLHNGDRWLPHILQISCMISMHGWGCPWMSMDQYPSLHTFVSNGLSMDTPFILMHSWIDYY